jgi:hypothetical protein
MAGPGKPGRPKGKWRNLPGRPCSICAHPLRWKIDQLLVTGDGIMWGHGRRKIAEKFEVSEHAVRRHAGRHITPEYKRAVLVGPLHSETAFRELAAEEGTTVLQNYRSIYNGHRERWLQALELGDDDKLAKHARVMSDMLWKMAQISREISPGSPTSVQTNIFMTPDFYNFERRAVKVLKRHPQALQDWIDEFRNDRPGPKVIEADADPKLIEATADAA